MIFMSRALNFQNEQGQRKNFSHDTCLVESFDRSKSQSRFRGRQKELQNTDGRCYVFTGEIWEVAQRTCSLVDNYLGFVTETGLQKINQCWVVPWENRDHRLMF